MVLDAVCTLELSGGAILKYQCPGPIPNVLNQNSGGGARAQLVLKIPRCLLCAASSWELLGQRPCQDDRLQLEVESEMEGDPPFRAPLCWDKDQVSMWIDENSRQRGSLRIEFIFCIQHVGHLLEYVLGSVGPCLCLGRAVHGCVSAPPGQWAC